MYFNTHTHTHTHTHIYIYIYREREREREKGGGRKGGRERDIDTEFQNSSVTAEVIMSIELVKTRRLFVT